MKKLSLAWLVIVLYLFRQIIFSHYIALPADVVAGAYYPWLDYKWGYSAGVPVKNNALSDAYSQFFLWKQLIAEDIRQGILPLWNRYEFSGTPLLADYHSAVLFPVNLLQAVLPLVTGWNLNILLSVFFAGFWMLLYLNNLIKSKMAILVGASMFALSGLMTTWTEFGTAVWAMGFVPLILFLVDRYVIANDRRGLYFLPPAIGLLILAGNVQIDIYLSVIYAAYLWLRVHKLRSVKILFLIMAFVCGILLTAVQLLPTYEYYRNSIRPFDKYSQKYNYGLANVSQFGRLWAADFFGNPTTNNDWSHVEYNEFSNFLGTIGFCLACASIIFLWDSELVKFFGSIAIAVLILGYSSPLSRAIYGLNIPLLTFSLASRIFFVLSLSVAVLTAVAINSFANPKFVAKIWIIPVFVAAITLILFLSVVPIAYRQQTVRNLLLPLGLIGVLIASTKIFSTKKTLLISLISVLMLLDISRYFLKFNPFVPDKLTFPKTAVTDFLTSHGKDYRMLASNQEVFPPNTWIAYHLESPVGYDPLNLLSYNRFMNVVNNQNYFNTPGRFINLTSFNQKYLDILNVKYIISVEDKGAVQSLLNNKNSAIKMVFSEGKTKVYENQSVLPRVFFVNSYQLYGSEADLANALASPDFDPKTTVLLDQQPKFKLSPDSQKEIINTVLSDNKIAFTTQTSSDQLLMLSQAYDKGWKLFLNGVRQDLLRADGGLSALEVPAGTNHWQLIYLPDALKLGALISLTTFFGLLLSIGILQKYEKSRDL